IEDRLDQQRIHAAGNQTAHLLRISGFHLIEGDHAKAGIVSIRRVRERNCQWAYPSRHKSLARGCSPNTLRPFATLSCRLFVDLSRQIAEIWIINDFLVKLGILPPAALSRIIHEELTLNDAGCAEGVRFNDICPRLQEAAMDIANHIGLRQGEEVSVVQQVLARVLEAVPRMSASFIP